MDLLSKEFLINIVFVNDFKLDFRSLHLNVLCIEGEDTEVNYDIKLSNIAYFAFRQEDYDFEFSVIDTFLEKFNESPEMEFMRSDRMQDFWVLRFHSGTHHMIVGFKDLQVSKS